MKIKSFIVFIVLFLIFCSCDSSELYNFGTDKEFLHYVITNYELADEKYDIGKYAKAINYYQEVINAYEFNKNNEVFHLEPSEAADDIINTFKKYYYSIYNIACSYALLGKYDEAELYLIRAINAGYPHLDYLLRDNDLEKLFVEKSNLASDVSYLYQICNNSNKIANKTIMYGRGPSAVDKYVFSDDGSTVIMFDVSVDAKGNYRLKGSYKIRNNFLILVFNEEDYLETKGYILGIGIQEEDCEKVHNKVTLRHVIPLFSIDNNKSYYEWPFLTYDTM